MSKNCQIPVIPLSHFTHYKKTKTLQIYSGLYGTPQKFFVESGKTGRVVQFVVDHDDMMDNEHYDGEACSYKPAEGEAECNIIRAFIVNWP